jgi:hypothetical protein
MWQRRGDLLLSPGPRIPFIWVGGKWDGWMYLSVPRRTPPALPFPLLSVLTHSALPSLLLFAPHCLISFPLIPIPPALGVLAHTWLGV